MFSSVLTAGAIFLSGYGVLLSSFSAVALFGPCPYSRADQCQTIQRTGSESLPSGLSIAAAGVLLGAVRKASDDF